MGYKILWYSHLSPCMVLEVVFWTLGPSQCCRHCTVRLGDIRQLAEL